MQERLIIRTKFPNAIRPETRPTVSVVILSILQSLPATLNPAQNPQLFSSRASRKPMKNEALDEKSCLLLFIYISHETYISRSTRCRSGHHWSWTRNRWRLHFNWRYRFVFLKTNMCSKEKEYLEYASPISQDVTLKSCHRTEYKSCHAKCATCYH
ncbi:hypothetical protein H113_03552 [Trichophyton rubrum MR1459]|nr:hypothetical protein H113_03552 [Trichophyton rubrum MR1459]